MLFMISCNIWDTGKSCFEKNFLVRWLQSGCYVWPISLNFRSKFSFIAGCCSTDHINSLSLGPIVVNVVIDDAKDHIF